VANINAFMKRTFLKISQHFPYFALGWAPKWTIPFILTNLNHNQAVLEEKMRKEKVDDGRKVDRLGSVS